MISDETTLPAAVGHFRLFWSIWNARQHSRRKSTATNKNPREIKTTIPQAIVLKNRDVPTCGGAAAATRRSLLQGFEREVCKRLVHSCWSLIDIEGDHSDGLHFVDPVGGAHFHDAPDGKERVNAAAAVALEYRTVVCLRY